MLSILLLVGLFRGTAAVACKGDQVRRHSWKYHVARIFKNIQEYSRIKIRVSIQILILANIVVMLEIQSGIGRGPWRDNKLSELPGELRGQHRLLFHHNSGPWKPCHPSGQPRHHLVGKSTSCVGGKCHKNKTWRFHKIWGWVGKGTVVNCITTYFACHSFDRTSWD